MTSNRGKSPWSDFPGGWAVVEITRCPSTYDGIKCYMTVGHTGSHSGLVSGGPRVTWGTEQEDDRDF